MYIVLYTVYDYILLYIYIFKGDMSFSLGDPSILKISTQHIMKFGP